MVKIATTSLGWAPQERTWGDLTAPGFNVLLEALMFNREREAGLAERIYSDVNTKVHDLVVNQGMDVSDAMAIVTAEMQSSPDWGRIRELLGKYLPHALTVDEAGQIGLKFTPNQDIIIAQYAHEQEKEIETHRANLLVDFEYATIGAKEQIKQFEYDLQVDFAYIDLGIQKELIEFDTDMQERLLEIGHNLDKAYREFDLEATHEWSKKMEQFLSDLGLEEMAAEYGFKSMLQAELGAIEAGHLMVDRETQVIMSNLNHKLELIKFYELHGMEKEMERLKGEVQKDIATHQADINRAAQDRAAKIESDLLVLDNKLQEGRIKLTAEEQQMSDRAKETHELLMQSIELEHYDDALILQHRLQKEYLELEKDLQLKNDIAVLRAHGIEDRELEKLKGLIIEGHMAIKFQDDAALIRVQGEVQQLVDKNQSILTLGADMVMADINHINDMARDLAGDTRKADLSLELQARDHAHEENMWRMAEGMEEGPAFWLRRFRNNLERITDGKKVTDDHVRAAMHQTIFEISNFDEESMPLNRKEMTAAFISQLMTQEVWSQKSNLLTVTEIEDMIAEGVLPPIDTLDTEYIGFWEGLSRGLQTWYHRGKVESLQQDAKRFPGLFVDQSEAYKDRLYRDNPEAFKRAFPVDPRIEADIAKEYEDAAEQGAFEIKFPGVSDQPEDKVTPDLDDTIGWLPSWMGEDDPFKVNPLLRALMDQRRV